MGKGIDDTDCYLVNNNLICAFPLGLVHIPVPSAIRTELEP